MERKNINCGFKKLRVWQDAIALFLQKKQKDQNWVDNFLSK